jgi:hypothetical protein
VSGQLFSPGTPVFTNNKTDRHDIAEIFLKVALYINGLLIINILHYKKFEDTKGVSRNHI